LSFEQSSVAAEMLCDGVHCGSGNEWGHNAVFPIGVPWYFEESELGVSETFAREFLWEQHLLQIAEYALPTAAFF
jgi:hypothetical protein